MTETRTTKEGQQNEARGGNDAEMISRYLALPESVKSIINLIILDGDKIAAAGSRSEAPAEEKTEAEKLAALEEEKEKQKFKNTIAAANDFCSKKGIFCNLQSSDFLFFYDCFDKYDILVNAYNLGAKKAFMKAKKAPIKRKGN